MSKTLQVKHSPPRVRQYHEPHSLGNGWVSEIVKTVDGMFSTQWGTFDDLEVNLAAAAEVSPRTLRLYSLDLIKGLGLEGQLKI